MDQQRKTDAELHQLLLARDDTALSRLIENYGEPLLRNFQRKYSTLREDQISGAVNDLFLGLWNKPQQYDPEKSSLATYLNMALSRDLANLAKERKKTFKISQDDVGLLPDSRNNMVEDPGERMDAIVKLKLIYEKLAEIFPEEPLFTLASLYIEEERKRERYAEVLEILHLPKEEWEKKVDYRKDSIRRKLKQNQWEETLQKIRAL